MDLLFLEVDGSLANPYAAAAVALWTAVLSGLAMFWVRQPVGSWRMVVWAALFAVGLLVTARMQLAIGNVLYQVTEPRQLLKVGFWGGLPVWIAPTVSCGVAVIALLHIVYQIRNRRAQRAE